MLSTASGEVRRRDVIAMKSALDRHAVYSRKTRMHLALSVLLTFGFLASGTLADAPVVSANIYFQDVTYYESNATGRLAMEVCNLSLSEMRNVNVRPASNIDHLNQGVVQFGTMDGGTCASTDADFRLETQQLDETGGISVRIAYDIAGASNEVLVQADMIEQQD